MLGFGSEESLSKSKSEVEKSLVKSQQQGKSPQKNLATKGPPKIISESLEIDSYQGVKVTNISVKPVMMSVAQLRAKHESSSMRSQANMSLDGRSQADDKVHNSQSQQLESRSRHTHGDHQDAMSTVTNRKNVKTIMEVLHEKIAAFASRSDGQHRFGVEFG